MSIRIGPSFWLLTSAAATLALVGSFALAASYDHHSNPELVIVCAPAAPGWSPVCQEHARDGSDGLGKAAPGRETEPARFAAAPASLRGPILPPGLIDNPAAPPGVGLCRPGYGEQEWLPGGFCRPPPTPPPPTEETVIPAPGALGLMLLALGALAWRGRTT